MSMKNISVDIILTLAGDRQFSNLLDGATVSERFGARDATMW